MHRADNDVVTLQHGGEACDIIGIGLQRRDARQRRDSLRMASDGGNGVAAAGQFGENTGAGITGGADQGDFHLQSPYGN
jgi:hypothetical protein